MVCVVGARASCPRIAPVAADEVRWCEEAGFGWLVRSASGKSSQTLMLWQVSGSYIHVLAWDLVGCCLDWDSEHF